MADEHSTTTEAPSSEHHGAFPPFAKETFASQLFWLVICFAALYIMVSKLILPRMSTIMAERRDRIDGDLAEAGRMKTDADAAVSAYEKSLADARARAQSIAAENRDKVHAQAEANRKDLEPMPRRASLQPSPPRCPTCAASPTRRRARSSPS
jgi:F-type H+-transporting ATPase subunit b